MDVIRDSGVVSVAGFARDLNKLYVEVCTHIRIKPVGMPVFNPFIIEQLFAAVFQEALEEVIPARYLALLRTSPLAFLIAIVSEFEWTWEQTTELLLRVLPSEMDANKRDKFIQDVRQLFTLIFGIIERNKLSQANNRRQFKVGRSRIRG